VDCRPESGVTRVYFGGDGVMVPPVTEVEKKGRREKGKGKRRWRGKKARPLPARKAGADQKDKEFKIVAYYDETRAHRPASGTRGDADNAEALMALEALYQSGQWDTYWQSELRQAA